MVSDMWSDLTNWVDRHDTALDLTLLWILVVGFAMLAVVKAATWWVIRYQHDVTKVGKSLKYQKLAETVMFSVLSVIYGIALFIYYTEDGTVFGTWQRFGLRLILAAGIIGAVVAGIQFVRAMQDERWGKP
jgi:ABC-type sulfate transport system permease subunit